LKRWTTSVDWSLVFGAIYLRVILPASHHHRPAPPKKNLIPKCALVTVNEERENLKSLVKFELPFFPAASHTVKP
ncbi:hypothetical protein VIGAN_05084000, partial [Vigna angularis var. angularis]